MITRIATGAATSTLLDRREFLEVSGLTGTALLIGGPAAVPGASAADTTGAQAPRARAIVIGINRYDSLTPELDSPVRDACRFAEWLVQKAGVKASDVALFTSPLALPTDAPRVSGVTPALASRDNIETAITQYPNDAGDGERLFFYYSGHGTAYQNKSQKGTIDEQDAIVPCDVTAKTVGTKPIPIYWILGVLRASPCSQQFFVFDACRNLAKVMPVPISEVPDVPLVPPIQYVAFATAPRNKTLDSKTGSFTDLLLAGLIYGKGSSALLDPRRKLYLVRWHSLVDFVGRQINQQHVSLGLDDQGHVIYQQPEQQIIRDFPGVEDPCLAALKPEDVAPVTLAVVINPPGLRAGARVSVLSSTGGFVVQRATTPADKPYIAPLKPGYYTVLVEVENTSYSYASELLDVTDNYTCKVDLEPAPVAMAAAPPSGSVTAVPAAGSIDPSAITIASVPAAPGSGADAIPFTAAAPPDGPVGGAAGPLPPPPARQTGSLKLVAPERLDQIELMDAGGAAVRWPNGSPCTGLGSLETTGLAPGVYRARVYQQSGPVIERIIPLAGGVRKEVSLGGTAMLPAAAPPILNELPPGPIAFGLEQDDAPVSFSPNVAGFSASGPAAYLVQAMRAADNDPGHAAMMSKAVGHRRINGPHGVRVIVGINLNGPDEARGSLKSIKVSLGKLDEPIIEPLAAGQAQVAGVAVYSVEREPGPYLLRLERQGELAEYALIVLKERLTEVVVEIEAERTYVSQFLPESHPPIAPDADALFRLDRIERAMQTQQWRSVPAALRQLVANRLNEPMALLLRALLVADGVAPEALGLAQADRDVRGQPEPSRAKRAAQALEAAAAPLANLFPELPDGHVALAWALEAKGQADSAKTAYLEGLNRGLPVLARFLKALDHGVSRFELANHPRAGRLRQAAKNQIPLLLWSASRPAQVEPS